MFGDPIERDRTAEAISHAKSDDDEKNEDPDNKIQSNILNGALFGLMVYGIYNFTAGAVLSDWSGKVMIYDIIWGMFVYAVAATVGSLV